MNTRLKNAARRVLGRQRAIKTYLFAKRVAFPFRYAANVAKLELLWSLTPHSQIKSLNRYEARMYSQNGEDGMLAATFRKVGLTDRFCVEFGVGDGTQCNTAYLTKKKGWSHLWMDSIEDASGSIKKEFITAENINELFAKYKVPRTFDLLSVDIDYNTYWVWKALEGYSPRVVVIEYNPAFPPTESLAVPYDPQGMWDGTRYYGASLLALAKLGADKGYTLVGCDDYGVNAFFVRSDLSGSFAKRSIEDVYRPPRRAHARARALAPCDRPFAPV